LAHTTDNDHHDRLQPMTDRPKDVIVDFTGTLFWIEDAETAVREARGPVFVPMAAEIARLGGINGAGEAPDLGTSTTTCTPSSSSPTNCVNESTTARRCFWLTNPASIVTTTRSGRAIGSDT
jgi:hypothetical protein